LKTISSFARFCIVGTICTCIDAFIYFLFLPYGGYKVSIIIGYIIGLIFNYFLTIYWTFKTHPNPQNAFGVITAHLINLFIIRMGLMYVFTNKLMLTEKLSYIPTMIISVIINYILIHFIITKTNRKHLCIFL